MYSGLDFDENYWIWKGRGGWRLEKGEGEGEDGGEGKR